MKLKYVGPFDEVEVEGVGTVKRLGVIEVEPPISTGLKDQADWEHVTTKKKED